jgi:hypothetical protein
MDRRTRTRLILFSLLASLTLAGPVCAFNNTVNNRFASRCNGPQGAVVVPHARGGAPLMTPGQAVYAQHSLSVLSRAANSFRRIQRLAHLNPRSQPRFPRTVVHTLNNQLIQPQLVHAAATGDLGDPSNRLSFTFTGWSSGDQATLQAYLNNAMPKAYMTYGTPAFNLTVNIIQDATVNALQGGTYDTLTNELRIPPLSGNLPEDTYVLLMLVLNAFHDDVILYYDAWEQGFIGAAAYAIQTQPGVSPDFDPSLPGPFYALSVYEANNLPELGNSTFYPTSGAANMLVWRIAMARAAWLKCWIEDNNFFANFNAQYYANFVSSLPGDVPSLKEMAASVLPQVEGQPFEEWYEHQYVLDTSVHTGAKLFTWNAPLDQSVILIPELYETLPSGDERPFGGQATTIYWNYENALQLYAEEGNSITIPPGGTSAGEGYLIPTFFNIGGPQRITVQMDVAGLRRFYIYPYGMRGDGSTTNLYGGVVGLSDGTLNVTGGNGLTDVAVSRGIWGGRITTGALSPMQVSVEFKNTAGQSLTRLYNIGWDSYAVILEAGDQALVSHTFPYGTNGMYLMSVPVMPLARDAATVLGIDPARLLLAWWDATLAGVYKYRIWPAFPFQSPGNGYWLRVLQDTTVNVQGILLDEDQAVTVPLSLGWNSIGSPRGSTVNLSDLQVQVGNGSIVTWDQAVANRLVQTQVYNYDQNLGYQLQTSLDPWVGYWIRCLSPTGATLIFPPLATDTSGLQALSAAQAAPAAKGRILGAGSSLQPRKIVPRTGGLLLSGAPQ